MGIVAQTVRVGRAAIGITGTDRLYGRDVDMAHLPRVSDRVELFPSDDGEPGPMCAVAKVWFAHDGVAHVELAKIQVNPSDAFKHAMLRSGVPYLWWPTAHMGDPHALLSTRGWEEMP